MERGIEELHLNNGGFFPRHCLPENLGGRKVSIAMACSCDHIVKNYLNNVEECIDAHTEAIFQKSSIPNVIYL